MDFVNFMTIRRIVAAPTALFVLALCGCSTEAAGSSADTRTFEAVSPTDVGYEPGDPGRIGAGLKVGTVTTRNEDEAAVGAAWTTYWRARLQAWNRRDPGVPAIKTVSTGTAAQDLLEGVANLKENGTFMVGLMKAGVIQVDVTGDEAVLRGCVNDSLRIVDADGETVNDSTSVSKVRVAQAVRKGSQWVIAKEDLGGVSAGTCDPGI